jgi:uncharacterized protein (TIGR03083 family)
MVEVAAATDRVQPVPTCPNWSMADLISHTARIHRWATQMVASGERVRASGLPTAEPGGEPQFLNDGIGPLVETLRATDPNAACWNFTSAPQVAGFWTRRQTHETTIHRIDAELTAGLPITPQDPTMAADLIDEKLRLLAANTLSNRDGIDVGGSVRFVCSDAPGDWTVHTTDGVFTVDPDAGRGDVTLRGTAHALSMVAWGRPLTDDISITGDASIPARLIKLLSQ